MASLADTRELEDTAAFSPIAGPASPHKFHAAQTANSVQADKSILQTWDVDAMLEEAGNEEEAAFGEGDSMFCRQEA